MGGAPKFFPKKIKKINVQNITGFDFYHRTLKFVHKNI
jgi:hypothetical protein